MYARHNNRPQGITIPKNYSGNAFSEGTDIFTADEPDELIISSESEILADTDADAASAGSSEKRLFPFNMGNEELILIGIILLISQNENGDGIIPILLAVLFLGGGIPSL